MELDHYGSLMKLAGKEKYFTLRKSIAQEAAKSGIKPTARKFGMSKNTVKLWLNRFKNEGNDGLIDRRNGPNKIPHKMPEHMEKEIVNIRKKAPCYGARRLKYFYDLEPSLGAIQRVLKDYGLTRRVRRKHQKKNDLRAVKEKYRSFEMLQMDIKYLTDIPPYWESMKTHGLPRFQYTVRDVKSGMLFLGYGDEITVDKSIRMLNHVLAKIAPSFNGKVTVQTDNGVEFSGTTRKHENNHFSAAVNKWGAKHRYIPPGHCNANGDVESIHATIEHEFYNLTRFSCRKDFMKKAESYRSFYNLQRPNWSKRIKSPWFIAQQDHSGSDLATSVQFTEVIDLERNLESSSSRGQTLPVLPDTKAIGSKKCKCEATASLNHKMPTQKLKDKKLIIAEPLALF